MQFHFVKIFEISPLHCEKTVMEVHLMIRHRTNVWNTYFLSREVVGSQQSSNEADVDLENRHLSILEGGAKHITHFIQLHPIN